MPLRAYFHQGGHGGAPPLEMMNKWFTRYLYGVENGVENEPKAWIVREVTRDDRAAGARRASAGRAGGAAAAAGAEPFRRRCPYADYPNPDAALVTLHLRPGGGRIGGLALERLSQNATEKIVDNVDFAAPRWRCAEASEHRLLLCDAAS